ncbi:MAG: TIGR03960 family B12-binding radical SAM protein [Microthrixaceae bacterium]
MSSIWTALEPLLERVQRPARYIGLEDGAVVPEYSDDDPVDRVSWLLTYPDSYEIRLPNQGLQICARSSTSATMRWPSGPMRLGGPRGRTPGRRPAALLGGYPPACGEFDVIAFNLSAELTFTNVLNCIDLAGVPVRSADRDASHPLVGVGGHCTTNPEPLADFVDFVVLGDGEEAVGELTEVISCWKRAGSVDRQALLEELAAVEGVYVPSLYEPIYSAEGDLVETVPKVAAAPDVVEKRTVADLAEWAYPKNQLVPLTEVVHDRLNVEVFRGCTRGCRFCQAGMITRPVRERPAEQVREMISNGLARTGYDEVALTSLSTADFSGIEPVVDGIMSDPISAGQVSVSLPSLRVDAFTVGLATSIRQGRRTGLTFAPEAGTWRMRQIINKLIREEDLYEAVESAYSEGWRRMKLYFLTGLPSETDEDTLGIATLARNCVAIGKKYHQHPSVTVSVGGFVPKSNTPFQWFGQNTVTELQRKIYLLRDELKRDHGVQLKWHDPKTTLIEGVFSRGDRRIGDVLEAVWRAGGTFQEWTEYFDLDRWEQALADAGLSAEYYANRHRHVDEALPWDHLSAGLHKDFLAQDWADALAEVGLPDCRWTPCYDCGACTGYGIEHVVASAVPPAGGSQGTGQDVTSDVGAVPVMLGTTGRAPAGVGS